MLENQPFYDILFDRLLCKDIANRGGVNFCDAKLAFRRIAVVGMLFPTQQKFKGTGFPMPDELSCDDKVMVHQALCSFSAAGIPTSPNVEFDIYNLLPPIQSDFLRAADPLEPIEFPNVDLVIINYVPAEDIGYTPLQKQHDTSDGFENLDHLNLSKECHNRRYRSVSRLNNMNDIWAQACLNIGAKFVVTYNDFAHDEINTLHLGFHEQMKLIVSSQAEHSAAGHYIGVVANARTLSDYEAHARENSLIGAGIKRQAGLKVG
jgi:hypothetical protein